MAYGSQKEKPATERAHERIDVRVELHELEKKIELLKVDYEQFFLGMVPFPPDKLHLEVRNLIRRLKKAPFKNAQMNFALRTLENRYQTYNTYWNRVNRQREDGTYCKDVFKANLRQRRIMEEAEAQTDKGKAKGQVKSLFQAYKSALEKETGKKHNIDYDAFKNSLAQRAKDFKQKHGKDKKLSFKIVVQDGKVSVKARVKD